jgi:hypothetical protein
MIPLEKASLIPDYMSGPLQNTYAVNNAPTNGKAQAEWIPFTFNLAAGISQTFFSESGIPEYWIVTIMPNNGILVSVSAGANVNPNAYFMAGGGSLRIPGFSEYVTVLNLSSSSNPAVGNVVAGRLYKDMFINPGQNR